MSKSIPQLKDIAKHADVSLATASIILRNGKGRFADETRQRVIDAAKKLGWRRNLLVESIQTGKTKTVGVLVPPFDSYWTNILSGIHQEITQAGYMPITLWPGDSEKFDFVDAKQGLELIHMLADRRVEGLIVWPDIADGYHEQLKGLTAHNIPVVVVDHQLSGDIIADSVQTDEEQGGQLAAEHLASLGHKNIGCLGEYVKSARSWQMTRQRYFEFALYAISKDIKCRVWHSDSEQHDGGLKAAIEMLSDENRPTAVFAETDHVAIDVYNAAAILGIKIPQELSVIGFSDLSFAKSMRPPLTTVKQKAIDVGRHAGKLVLQRIKNNEDTPPHTVRIGCELVARESTAGVPK